MTYPSKGYGTYGPDPWRQSSWDARAAGNFICGGMGSGLIVFTAVAGSVGMTRVLLVIGGLALIGLGLFCVSLELGRPLRALNVFRNPRTSWMAREAWASALLVPACLAFAVGIAGSEWLALALAMLFVFCQARLLQAARGIPAWREPTLVPLIVATGLTEGAGVYLLIASMFAPVTSALVAAFAILLIVRAFAWRAYRQRVAVDVAADAAAALDRAGQVMELAGTAVPIALAAAILTGVVGDGTASPVAAVAGLCAALAGTYFKFALVTRAGFNQGFALPHLPVRGARM